MLRVEVFQESQNKLNKNMKKNCLLKDFWGVLGVESFPLLPVRELEPLEGRERAGHEDGDQ